MKHALNDVIGYSIETNDGLKGTVKDFLFEEERWIVRYLVADLGIILPGKKVVIPKALLKQPDWTSKHFLVDLSKKDLENCPPLESEPTISRKYEESLNRYYKIENFWAFPHAYATPIGGNPVIFPKRPLKIPKKVGVEKNTQTKVRSFNEVKGYHIEAVDGKIGHVDDLLVDDLDWQIVYALMDTKNWVPWSKKVLVGTHWMQEINYKNKEMKINLNKESIQSAPEFDFSEPITDKYEKELFNYYESSTVEH